MDNQLGRRAFTYKTVKTGTAIDERGAIKTVSEEGGHKLNPGVFFAFSLMPEGPLPGQGFHLTGSLDIDGGPGGEFGKGMNLAAMTGFEVDGKVQWSFSPDLCSDADRNYRVNITIPSEPIELTYNNGELTGSFYAEPVPNEKGLRSKVMWRAFEVDGSTRVAEPENFNSDSLSLTFKEIPDDNDAFGEKEISATLGSLERCTDAAEKKATVFFEREGNDNSSDDPNWMWYWLQTPAGKGFAPCAGVGGTELCEGSLGYFISVYADIFFICDNVLTDLPADPFKLLAGRELHSIDVFAIIATHENKHRENHRKWWTGIPGDQWPHEPNWADADHDIDSVPDDIELEDGMAREGYDPLDWDSFDIGFPDSEVSAYQTADQWAVGSADEEDWACPGAQGEDVCKEEPR